MTNDKKISILFLAVLYVITGYAILISNILHRYSIIVFFILLRYSSITNVLVIYNINLFEFDYGYKII